MALAYTKWTWDRITGEEIKPSSIQFSDVERRLEKKKESIEDLKNEYNLLEKQAFGLYKNQIHYYEFDFVLENAKKWFRMLKTGTDSDGKKIDKRKKYMEKDLYDRLIEDLKKYLGIEDFEIIEFIDFNYGEATQIRFTSHDHLWYLTIPDLRRIQLKSYHNYGCRCFALEIVHRDEDCSCSWSVVDYTFIEEDLKEIMSKGIEQYCKDE